VPHEYPGIKSLEEALTSGPTDVTMDERVLSRQPLGTSNSVERKVSAIVYVLSDESETDMDNYSRENWINVPFESIERAGIKRYFQVCAKQELQELE